MLMKFKFLRKFDLKLIDEKILAGIYSDMKRLIILSYALKTNCFVYTDVIVLSKRVFSNLLSLHGSYLGNKLIIKDEDTAESICNFFSEEKKLRDSKGKHTWISWWEVTEDLFDLIRTILDFREENEIVYLYKGKKVADQKRKERVKKDEKWLKKAKIEAAKKAKAIKERLKLKADSD